jgi:hypothetical protein
MINVILRRANDCIVDYMPSPGDRQRGTYAHPVSTHFLVAFAINLFPRAAAIIDKHKRHRHRRGNEPVPTNLRNSALTHRSATMKAVVIKTNVQSVLGRLVVPLAVVAVGVLVQWQGGWGVAAPGPTFPFQDRWRFATLIALKQYQYACLAVFEATAIALGMSRPLVSFKVLADPPSIFINWEILPEQRQEFLRLLDLPEWLEMRPIHIVEGEEERRYFLSLNIYEVAGLSGLLSGYRAEWSIFVGKKNGEGPASFLVVEARHSMFSQDSVNGYVRGTVLEHSRNSSDHTIISFVHFGTNTTFRSVIATGPAAKEVYVAREFIAANDLIYWKNGVADRSFYDGSLVNSKLWSIDPAHVAVEDNTYFAQFRKADPSSVLVFQQGLNLVLSPWYNLDRPH